MVRCRLGFMVGIIILLSGCASYRALPAGAVHLARPGVQSQLETDDWMSYPLKYGQSLTQDGVDLGYIEIIRQPLDERLEHTRLSLRPDMLPVELMELEMDDLRSQRKIGHLTIDAVDPYQLSGVDGFRMEYMLRRHSGLEVQGIRYGILKGKWFYRLQMEAARGHYFEKYRKEFENFAKYFKVL